MVRVLVLGSGGREHALCWKLSRDGAKVHCSPGNGGISRTALIHQPPSPEEGNQGWVKLARDIGAELVVIGPEGLLADGLADDLAFAGIGVFGPGRRAAALEASKVWAKEFMSRYRIPTARFAVADTEEEAKRCLGEMGAPVVIKADGLAAGKGVVVAGTRGEAEEAIRRMMRDRVFGDAGERLVLEERLTGPELSVLAFTDGERVAVMPPARDHKRLLEGNNGPNTGGMGAMAPVPGLDPGLMEEIQETVLLPAVRGMAREGVPFRGILYAGLMLTPQGPQVLEFNARFGDPETQVLLPLLESNLAEILEACAKGRLAEAGVRWKQGAAATVVLASEGYPEHPVLGRPISGLPEAEKEDGVVVFHAGTRVEDGGFFTTGGRVINVTGEGSSLGEALERTYRAAERIHFDGKQYRRDIGR